MVTIFTRRSRLGELDTSEKRDDRGSVERGPATSVKFMLDTDVVSDEVSAAFFDKPYVVVWPAAVDESIRFDPEAGATTYAAPDSLDRRVIDEMLAERNGAWKLAVMKGSATGVLDGELLRQAWNGGSGALTFVLRSPTPGEKLILDDSGSLYGPSASWTRVKDAVGYPVAQVGLVATGAGLFGLLALQDDIGHTWAMKAATVVAAIAVLVSVFYGVWLREEEVSPARLDLLRERQTSMFDSAISRARWGLGLLLVALGFAIYATWPSGNKSASATIGNPTVASPTANMRKVTLTVKWSDLDTSVALVSSTITGESNPVVTSKPPGSASLEQPLETNLATGTNSVTVDTRALDKEGREVGMHYTKQLTVPNAGVVRP